MRRLRRWFRAHRPHDHVWALLPGSRMYVGCLRCDEQGVYWGGQPDEEWVQEQWVRWPDA